MHSTNDLVMYSKELEKLINAVLADGSITEKERAIIHKRAEREGVDLDEIDLYLDGKLNSQQKSFKSSFSETENSTHQKDIINIQVNNKTSINKNVLGWLVVTLFAVLLTYFLNQVLYKTGFGIYTFALGLIFGAVLHAKLFRHE